MATPAARALTPRAPEKGVFPLDHFGECKQEMSDYMACLRESSYTTERCKHLSKRYLECRMSNGLMAQQDLAQLGFQQAQRRGDSTTQDALAEERRGGFVAGLRPDKGNTTKHKS